MTNQLKRILCATAALAVLAACGDDDDEGRVPEADRIGVGAQCSSDNQCFQDPRDGGIRQTCLMQFKGGYCGVEDCTSDDDCPERSACVNHTDLRKYCFRICANKPECNRNRSLDNESNCSSNVEFVNMARGDKACVPPSG